MVCRGDAPHQRQARCGQSLRIDRFGQFPEPCFTGQGNQPRGEHQVILRGLCQFTGKVDDSVIEPICLSCPDPFQIVEDRLPEQALPRFPSVEGVVIVSCDGAEVCWIQPGFQLHWGGKPPEQGGDGFSGNVLEHELLFRVGQHQNLLVAAVGEWHGGSRGIQQGTPQWE